jgi:PAS domain S-box-containing protein
MDSRNRIFILIAIFTTITILVTGIAIYTLYRVAINGQRDRLTDIIERQSSLIETIAHLGMRYGKKSPDDIEKFTLMHLQEAKYERLGRTGEITIAHKEGDQIVYILARRYKDVVSLQPISFNSRLAEPMRYALSGRSGTVVGLDYRGEKVIAAYKYITLLNIGITAKIDFSEIRDPFIQAGIISGAIAIVAIIFGAVLFIRISNPMILQLAESEKKYRQLIETLQEGIWAIDKDGCTTFVNPRMAEMLGYDSSEMLGKHLFSFMDEDGVRIAKAKLERRKQGIIEQHDFEFIRKDGQRVYMTLETAPILDDKGRYAGALAGAINITERNRMEAALRSSEEKFRSIVEQSADGIALTDERGIVIEWNRSAEQITGIHRKEALGQPLWDVQYKVAIEENKTPAAYENLKTMFSDFLITRKADWLNRLMETVLQRPDGTRRIVQAIVFPVQKDRVFMAGSILRDVTENKQAEEKLKLLVKEKDVLLKEVYHRVKNNFQIIASLLNLQSHKIQDPRTVEVLKESHDRVLMMSLIHEKLYQSADLAGINFGEYIHDLAFGLFNSYGADPSRISLKIDAADVQLGIDTAIPCGLIVNELVSNSLKYAFPKDGKKEGVIGIKLRKNKTGTVLLTVADNGTGLPVGMDIRKTTSLGLHLVTLLAEDQLHGKLRIDKKNGTKFTVEFKA